MQDTEYKKIACTLLRAEPFVWPENLNSEAFIDFAQLQGILCLLANHPDLTLWPKPINQAIVIARAAANSLLKQRQKVTHDLSQTLAQKRIQALLFKGAANAYLIYPTPDLRQHADIDMLIKERDYQTVIDCMIDLGFEIDPIKPTKFGPFQTTAKLKQQTGPSVLIDLHWKINNRLLLADCLNFDEVWHDALPIQDYGENTHGFDYKNSLLACCIHEAGSLPVERNKLIALYDAYLIMNKLGAIGIKDVLDKAHEKKIATISIDYMTKSMSLFADDSQIKMLNDLISSMPARAEEPSSGLLKHERTWLDEQLLDWHGVDGIKSKIEYIASKLTRKLSYK